MCLTGRQLTLIARRDPHPKEAKFMLLTATRPKTMRRFRTATPP